MFEDVLPITYQAIAIQIHKFSLWPLGINNILPIMKTYHA